MDIADDWAGNIAKPTTIKIAANKALIGKRISSSPLAPKCANDIYADLSRERYCDWNITRMQKSPPPRRAAGKYLRLASTLVSSADS